jgi:hypothetical protein
MARCRAPQNGADMAGINDRALPVDLAGAVKGLSRKGYVTAA